MVSSQSPLNEQYHRDDTVPLVPGPIAANARHGEPMNDPTNSSQHIDITAEETCPAPTVQMLAEDDAQQRAPAIQTAQVPSATTFKLMSQLEALASDLAVRERDSSDQHGRELSRRIRLFRRAAGNGAVNLRYSSSLQFRSVCERQALDWPADRLRSCWPIHSGSDRCRGYIRLAVSWCLDHDVAQRG